MKKAAKKFYDNKLLFSVLIAGIAFAVLLFFSDFNLIYSTNDDYMISVLIQAGDDRNIFMNFFLTHLNVLIQRALPFVNWFVLLQVINSFLAVCTVNYVLLRRNTGAEGWLFAIGFDALTVASVMITVQWTHTTSMMCAAGFMLLYHALTDEKRRGFRIFQIIFALFLTVYGSLYRLVAFEMCVVIFFVWCVCCVIRDVSVSLRERKGFFKALFKSLKGYLRLIVCSVLIIALAFGAEISSNAIKNTDPAYAGYITFNNARSAVNDFSVMSYSGSEEFYHSIGIDSAEELEVALSLFTDKDFYDAEKLQAIADYAKEHGKGTSSALSLAMRFIKKEIKSRIPIEDKKLLLLVLGAGALLGIAVCLLLLRFRDKFRWLFPVLLTVVWVLFLKYYGIKFVTIMFLPIGIFIVLTVFFFNRYHFLYCAAMSAAIMALYFYQNFARMRYRVSYTFLLPALVFLLLMYKRENMQVRFRTKRVYLKGLYLSAAVLCCTAVSVQCNTSLLRNSVAHVNIGFDRQVQDYVNENPDKVYAHPYGLYPVLDESFFNPLMTTQFPDNTIPFGDWQMASAFYDGKLRQNGVEHLFKEFKNSDRLRLMISLRSTYDYTAMLETYLNAHYADEGETIRLEEEAFFNPQYERKDETYSKYIGVYKVITE